MHQVPIHPSYSYDGLTITSSSSADENSTHSSSHTAGTADTEYVIKEPGYMYFDDFQDIVKGLGRVKSATGNSEVSCSSVDRERIGTVADVAERLAETKIMKLPYPVTNHSSADNTSDKTTTSSSGDGGSGGGEGSSRLDDLIPLLFPTPTPHTTTPSSHAIHTHTLEQYTPLSEAQWDLIADLFGETSHVRTSVDWFRRILTDLNLIDTYTDTYPNQLMRYTCYDQQTNRRYVNLGSRIDLILVSRDWWLSSSSSATTCTSGVALMPSALLPSSTEFVDEDKSIGGHERDGRYMLQGYELFTDSGDENNGGGVLESFRRQGLYSSTPITHTNDSVDTAHSHTLPPLPPFLPFKSPLAQQHINTLLDKNRPSSTSTGSTLPTDLSLPNQPNLTYEMVEGRAALLATTGYNLFQPASFEGGGIPNSTEVCVLSTLLCYIAYIIYSLCIIICYIPFSAFILIYTYI